MFIYQVRIDSFEPKAKRLYTNESEAKYVAQKINVELNKHGHTSYVSVEMVEAVGAIFAVIERQSLLTIDRKEIYVDTHLEYTRGKVDAENKVHFLTSRNEDPSVEYILRSIDVRA
jgi:hypothetical protein